VGGAGDQAAQAVGAGILNEGDTSVTLGTSGVVFSASDSYRADPQGVLHAFCHAVPDKWHLMGVMLSAAGSLRWFRDAIAEMEVRQAGELEVDPYEILTEKAAKAPPGSEGLIFLPYLTGERTPYPNPNARGVYFGLSLRHDKAHMIRALLEGVAYGLRDSLELMKALGLDLNAIRASGGGARSDFWLQILANVFSKVMIKSRSDGGASLGAAMIAGVGVEAFTDFQAAHQKTMGEIGRINPNKDQKLYEDFYQLYRSLYEPLRPLFDLDQRLVLQYLRD
jgi:xylulokinase